MGILRSDRVSGLGGANAIIGSVSFAHDGDTGAGESGALQVENKNDALTFGTGDFTIEFWFYANRVGAQQQLYDGRGTGAGSNTAVLLFLSSSNKVVFFTTNANRITGSTTIAVNTWYHVALTRTGSTHTLYVNGSSDGTWSQSSLTYTGPTNNFSNIGSDDNGAGAYGLNGYISNVRVAKELIYSAAFTVPTTRLSATTDTTLICCQSPGNVLASYGGLNLNTYATNVNAKASSASRFAPDVGEDYGTTFEDNTKFDTKSYMVPPGGTTTQSNRGRGLLGGNNDGGAADYIQYITIQSQGNSVDFGNLTAARASVSSYSSSTRGIWAGGEPTTNIIQYVTIATTGDATDFGDLTLARRKLAGTSSATRGLTAGGNESPPSSPYPSVNVIDYTTIASAGNATDFGDLSGVRSGAGALSNTTRAVFGGGYVNGAPAAAINIIEYVTIATTGNTSDFGDLTNTRRYLAGVSSNTRGVFGSGSTPAQNNTIDFITIATTGNATDFGDATVANEHRAAISNSIRGVWAGTGTPAIGNTMDFVTIATTGNAQDFGDTATNMGYSAGCSDSHGGLSE